MLVIRIKEEEVNNFELTAGKYFRVLYKGENYYQAEWINGERYSFFAFAVNEYEWTVDQWLAYIHSFM